MNDGDLIVYQPLCHAQLFLNMLCFRNTWAEYTCTNKNIFQAMINEKINQLP